MNQIKFFAFFLLFFPDLIGQTILIDSCGIDDNAFLNRYEIECFQNSTSRDIDFKDKKIAFFYGNYGKNRITKKEYFDRWGKKYFHQKSRVSNQYLLFSEEEKERSSGYDIVIVSWSKIRISERMRRRIIKKLSRKKKRSYF